jgi:argininosuccinate lyase
VVRALTGAYRSLEFHDAVAGEAANDELLVAIDIAEELVAEGMPFRQAHERVGQLVATAVESNRSLRDVVSTTAFFERFEPLFEEGGALGRRRSPGASGPLSRETQSQRLQEALAEASSRL